jgi:hypothetical protein
MRLPMACLQCVGEGIPPSDVVAVELENSGLYRMVCKAKNHETVIRLQAQKFEVLFEIAVNAIVDSYHREAVASFTSALERFYEFCIEICCDQFDVEGSDFQQAWKRVSKQSERQLGGYVFAFLLAKKKSPSLLPESRVSFRNKVVHNGHIPSREEAIDFGEAVAAIILETLDEIRKPDEKYIKNAVFRHLDRLKDQANTAMLGSMAIASFFTLLGPTDRSQPTLREWIELARQKEALVKSLPPGERRL